MPVVREHLSISQFAELVGIVPARLTGLEMDKRVSRVTLVLEPEENDMAQTSGTFPQLTKGGTKIGGKSPKGKGGGRKGC